MKTTHRNAAQAKRRYQADPISIFRVLNRVQPFNQEELVRMETPVKLAFERIKAGTAVVEDARTVATAINVALIRSETIDPLCEQTCVVAQEAMVRTIDRYNRAGRWGFDGPALQDIPPAIDLHEQLLKLSTPLQMQQAYQESKDRMAKGMTL